MAGLVAGELAFITGIGTAIEGIGKGMPGKAVAVLYRAPLFSPLSALSNAKSLEGKKFRFRESALKAISTEPLCWKKRRRSQEGYLDQTGSTALNMLALERGLVEGAVLSPPFTGVMARKGFKILRTRYLSTQKTTAIMLTTVSG